MSLFIYKNIQTKVDRSVCRIIAITSTKNLRFITETTYDQNLKHLRNAYLSVLNARIYIAH